MSINVDKAFETTENGVLLTDADGNQRLYLTSGVGAPSGPAPINSWYFREDTQTMYYKWGAANSEWRSSTYVEFQRSNPNFQTTSATFVPALQIVAGPQPAGRYAVGWSYRSSNSRQDTDNETQVTYNGLALVTNVESGVNALGGGLGEQFNGFAEFTIIQTSLTISLDIRRTAGNGNALVNTMNLRLWRVD